MGVRVLGSRRRGGGGDRDQRGEGREAELTGGRGAGRELVQFESSSHQKGDEARLRATTRFTTTPRALPPAAPHRLSFRSPTRRVRPRRVPRVLRVVPARHRGCCIAYW